MNTFLLECLFRGIDIRLEGENLRVIGDLKPVTADYIRTHKKAIIKQLNSEHGACQTCGADTRSMITRPDRTIRWICSQCIDREFPRKEEAKA